ncbi:TrAP protein [Corchorus yellow vein virus - [Hoa Binh]]|uniref:AC2 n=2 Tax=Corchorus yellow vein virus TaxID=333361 RepID=A0A1B1NX84_9GEMI|nr:TrAP protein [Corchorus yellow vein virus - [Hoa Binh]]AAU29405.1 TrAP protein [Corchorus yellow vein virus - [Hoa Binh]]AND99824.1 AC2 [Corchorus yellow vein Vietnam virus [CN:FZ:2015]]ANS88315.1 AC2 [Corchorus yellow vein virus - [Hoa Binh]]
MTGPRRTPSTSPSRSLSTAPSIKPRHRHAKKVVRRRRIDLECGCTIYVSISCREDGFTHRGTHHCVSGREFRFYLGGSKSPLFQDNRRLGIQPEEHTNVPDPVQPQLAEASSSSQVFPEFPHLDDIQLADQEFFSSFLFKD